MSHRQQQPPVIDVAPGRNGSTAPTKEQLIEALNQDLSREYQAIIAYVIYSQVLKGPEYMSIAAELEKHAQQELQHALIIAKNIDYLGGMPTATPKPVKVTADAKEMLYADLQNENETVRNYRERVRQCETLGEYAIAEQIRGIIVDEQEHQIDLATALGKDVAEVSTSGPREWTAPMHAEGDHNHGTPQEEKKTPL
jgi:bacterioferritin